MELWDSGKIKRKAIEFSSGLDNKYMKPYDDYLIPYQLKLDTAYAQELHRAEYITAQQYDAINNGLKKLSLDNENGKLSVTGYEDVHSFVESKLHELYGDLVGNLHLGLSRNDQIITIMRMWMKQHTSATSRDLNVLISILSDEISKKGNYTFPGYSHHRIAMPTTYGELMNSYKTALSRDKKFLNYWISQYDECPLGVAAGFGTSIKINRQRLSRKLGFKKPTESMIDTVTTRWEPEACLAFGISILMNHLYVMSHDLIIYSMGGIEVIEFPEEYCTGSSIMPQKHNPDVLETIKRKAVDIQGETFKLLSIGRNISGYNRDTQGAKYWIINIFHELEGTLDIMADVLPRIRINEKQARRLLREGGAYAAAQVIEKTVKTGKSYRKTKLENEKKIKNEK